MAVRERRGCISRDDMEWDDLECIEGSDGGIESMSPVVG